MATFDKWDVLGSVTQDFLTDWIDAYWYKQSNSAGSQLSSKINIGKPSITIVDSSTWTSAVQVVAELTKTSDGKSIGNLKLTTNLEQITIGSVYPQYCFMSAGASGAYADCGTFSLSNPGYTLMTWINLDPKPARLRSDYAAVERKSPTRS